MRNPIEVEIAAHLSHGLTAKEIATVMNRSVNNIEQYKRRMLKRHHAKNSAHMVRIAFVKKLLVA